MNCKPNVEELDFDVSVQNAAQNGVQDRGIKHESLLRIVFAIDRAAAETEQFGDELKTMLQNVLGRFHLRSHGIHGVELQNRVEQILGEESHHLCVVCEVERDLRVGERGEEEEKLSGSAANRRTFVSTWKSEGEAEGYK